MVLHSCQKLFNHKCEGIYFDSSNPLLEEAQAGIKIAGRNINNLRYADDTTLWQKVTKEPLDESERGELKSWLKTLH